MQGIIIFINWFICLFFLKVENCEICLSSVPQLEVSSNSYRWKIFSLLSHMTNNPYWEVKLIDVWYFCMNNSCLSIDWWIYWINFMSKTFNMRFTLLWNVSFVFTLFKMEVCRIKWQKHIISNCVYLGIIN